MTSWKPTPSSGPTRWGSPLDIKEHEVDPLINMKMNRDRLGPTVCQMATLNTPRERYEIVNSLRLVRLA